MYRPSAQQFATVFRLQSRVETNVNGAMRISYADAAPAQRFGEFKPFHGSEAIRAGELQLQEGGTLTTWYASDYSQRGRVLLNDDPSNAYDIISVENVENRGIYAILKVVRVVSA